MSGGKLAIVGARGVGHHGGFETVVAELAPRLSDRGTAVYCSSRTSEGDHTAESFKGVRIMNFPLVFPKSYSIGKLFEVLYDSYFVIKARIGLGCDTVYCLGVASGFTLLLTKFCRGSTAVNVDGLEWRREKFGTVTRLFLWMSFLACCLGCDRIVLDNNALIEHVPKRFRRKIVCITYGVVPVDCSAASETALLTGKVVLERGGYWLVVARLEPENNIHRIISAYLASGTRRPLVVVGDCSSPSYKESLESLARRSEGEKRVVMPGSLYDRARLDALRCNCFAYIHGHSVGGTNPSLLEAMSARNLVICHDNPFNREVASDTALYFSDEQTLVEVLDRVERDWSTFSDLQDRARRRVEDNHGWDDIVIQHDRLFSEMRAL